MRRSILFGVVIAAFYAPIALSQNAATTQPAPAIVAPRISGHLGKPIELFNGKNLDGWVWVQRAPKAGSTTKPSTIDDVWSVRNSILIDKGKPTGYIRTEADYPANFVLTVEQRHINKGNGGVLFAITGPDKVWPHGLEVQGQTGEEGDIRNIAEFKMTMDKDRVEPKRLRRLGAGAEKPVGEWETIEVIVDNGNLTVTVNGVLTNVASETESLAGKIGLQAEGGQMEFRKIELTAIEKW